jgi:hypothetical protein
LITTIAEQESTLTPPPSTAKPPEQPPAVIRDYWMAALKFCATGRTAESLRIMAADPVMTEGLALLSGITEDEEREQVLKIADAIDELTAAGLTPVKCWYLAGLDQFLGPFPGEDAGSAAA